MMGVDEKGLNYLDSHMDAINPQRMLYFVGSTDDSSYSVRDDLDDGDIDNFAGFVVDLQNSVNQFGSCIYFGNSDKVDELLWVIEKYDKILKEGLDNDDSFTVDSGINELRDFIKICNVTN